MEFSIRQVREEDAASIVELLNPIIEAGGYTVMEGPLTLEGQLEFIRSFPERGAFHAAVEDNDGRVLGIQEVLPVLPGVNAFRHVGEIGTFISLGMRRNGIGRSLTEVTVQAARALGYGKLHASIRADNPQAVAFYLSQGFSIIGTAHRHAYVAGRYIDEILAEKFID